MKGSKKFHFEEFELDPEAVKKLLNPFKQKMDIMNAVEEFNSSSSVENEFERRRTGSKDTR